MFYYLNFYTLLHLNTLLHLIIITLNYLYIIFYILIIKCNNTYIKRVHTYIQIYLGRITSSFRSTKFLIYGSVFLTSWVNFTIILIIVFLFL